MDDLKDLLILLLLLNGRRAIDIRLVLDYGIYPWYIYGMLTGSF